ncbi:MAG: N-acetylmuramoyl-L-alanine amidase [Eubacteriales bacterium]
MKYIPRLVLNYTVYAFLFMGAAVLIGRAAFPGDAGYTAPTAGVPETEPPQIMIDPGHGGEDGGASVGDTLEKDLNLEISFCLSDLYSLFGIRSEMTRTEDTMLYDRFDDLEDYRGKKKTYDLRSRLRMAEESGAVLYVGVHMNKFPQEKYKGLQVYYSPNTDESTRAARMIQSYAKKYLDPTNDRETKKATNAIYILKRIKIPAVLVECGFLSNNEERALLETPEYRLKVAAVLFASTGEYLYAGGT